jgi:DinB superfamily
MTNKLPELLYEAWADFDRALTGLSADEMVATTEGSSFAWTAAHVANQVEAWINVRFQALPPHPLIGQSRFRVGGTGSAENWPQVEQGITDVRESARTFLAQATQNDLERLIPYDGSFTALRPTGIRLRYAIMRAIAHHYFHTGEIASKRDARGHTVGDFPGLLESCL